MKTKTRAIAATIKLIVAVMLLSLMQSCIKKEDFEFDKIAETHWNPNVALPLIHSALSIDNILNLTDTGTVLVDNTHFVTIVYKGNIYSIYGYEFLPLIDQSSNQAINLTAPEIVTLSSGSVTTTRNTILPFGVANGEHIDSMQLKNGMLDINISSVIRHSGVLTVSIPTAKLNGVPFQKNIPFTFNNQVPVIANGSFDLSGYKFDMTTTGSFNQFPVDYSVQFTNSGNLTLTTETFSIASSFNSLAIKNVFGYFGTRNITVNDDSSRISIFNNAIGGTLYFDDPKVQFLISNSFGMPLDAHFNSLYAYNATSGNIPIIGPGVPNPIPIFSPTIVGQTAHSNFSLDKTNCNLGAAMSQNPQYIGYNVNAVSNTGGVTQNFLEDSSRLNIDVRVELPLYGYAGGLVVQDTVDFKLDDVKEIEWAIFRINITNGFPVDANTQIYFLDSTSVILDSLISPPEQIINAGLIDLATGIVNQPTLKTTDEYFSKARLKNIYNAKKIVIRGILNSYNVPTLVKIYSDYILDVRLGVKAQLNMDIQ